MIDSVSGTWIDDGAAPCPARCRARRGRRSARCWRAPRPCRRRGRKSRSPRRWLDRPGSKIRSSLALRRQRAQLALVAIVRRRSPWRSSRSTSMPRPSSAISMMIWLPDWRARHDQPARSRACPRRGARPAPRCRDRSSCGRYGPADRASSRSSRDRARRRRPRYGASTDLPSSAAVSRTIRGSAENSASIFCMRVRVTVSRISATVSDSRSSAASTAGSISPSRSRRASSLRASTMSDMPLIIRSSRSTLSRTLRDGARWCRGAWRCATAGRASSASAAISRSSPLSSSADAGVDRLDQLADPVDDREHGVDQRGIGRALAVAHCGEHVLGGVAQPGEPRQIEKAAASLHRVDEAENRIEPRAVGRIRFPRDDLARERLQRLARLGDEFLEQIVHGVPGKRARLRSCRTWVKGAFSVPASARVERRAEDQHAVRRVRRQDRAPAFRDDGVDQVGGGGARDDAVLALALGQRRARSRRRAGPAAPRPGRTISTCPPFSSAPIDSVPPRTSASPAISARLSSTLIAALGSGVCLDQPAERLPLAVARTAPRSRPAPRARRPARRSRRRRRTPDGRISACWPRSARSRRAAPGTRSRISGIGLVGEQLQPVVERADRAQQIVAQPRAEQAGEIDRR